MLVVCLSALLSVQGAESAAFLLSDQELDNLLAPIALYPDPVLAVLLPASTYPTEVADAAAWLRSGRDPYLIDDQLWDESVRAVAHYPDVLYMMANNMDWTADLGDAFLNQPEDVARSIQRLRWCARGVGNLVSTGQQTVIIEGDYIQIIPAQPQYIYIPRYDPAAICIESPRPGISPFLTFGVGLIIGGWLFMDFDWGHHHVIYHGWHRRGWVDHARPYVHVTNVYINRSRPYINQTWRHDTSHGGPDKYWAAHPAGDRKVSKYPHTTEVRGRDTKPVKPSGGIFAPKGDAQTFSNRGKESRGADRTRTTTPPQEIGKRPTTPAPGVGKAPSQPAPVRESVQPARTPSTNFGGYRGGDEARSQSIRGQSSRQSRPEVRTPPPPVSRGGAPAGKSEPAGKPAAEGRQGKGDSKGKDDKRGPSR